MIYRFTVYPIECAYKILYLILSGVFDNYGLALILMSVITCALMRPLTRWAEKFQAEEKNIQSVLAPQLAAIKENFSGAEQHKKIQRLYKRYAYHPAFAIRSAAGIILQLPFLMAAYFMLDSLPNIIGQSWWLIGDLSQPDKLLDGMNLLPLLMTAINLLGVFFVKTFSRRDKMQASLVAILFLILLYDAPSALLIYWTCNNLLTTVAIVFNPTVPKNFSAAQARIKNFLSAEIILLSFSLTFFIFIPLDIYLTNVEEIWFSAKDIFPYLSGGAILCFIFLYAVEKFLPANAKKYFQVIFFALTLGFFMQSYLLNPDYRLVDMVQADRENYDKENLLNLILWAYYILLQIYLLKRHSAEKFLGAGKNLCLILIAVQIFSLCYIGTNNSSDKRDYNVLTTAHLLDVSSKENIIVLVLDMFDKSVFEEILQKEPELIAQLEGFTFYPDSLSLFGFTDYSLPQMLTGKAYDNSQSYSEYIQEAWDSSKEFYDILRKHGYDISVYTGFYYVAKNAPVDNLLNQEKTLSINRYTLTTLAKLTLFRCLPNYLKQNFVVNSSEIWKQEEIIGDIQPYSLSNFTFYSNLQKGLTLHDDKNSFRWYHIRGAHMPFNMTRDIKPTSNGTLYEQSVGALKIALTYLQQMKELNIYDEAAILILSDHGAHENGGDTFQEIKPLPLLLVKQPNEHGALKLSQNPVSYSQLQATILKRFPESSNFGEDFSSKLTTARLYRRISLTPDHPIVEYLVEPDATNNLSWHESSTLTYKPDFKNAIYEIGTRIDHRNIEPYLLKGWTRWLELPIVLTDGNKCELIFSIKNLKHDRDLELDMVAFQDSQVEADLQKVGVYVNETFVTSLEMNKIAERYKIIIPHDLLKSNELHLSFTVSDTLKFFNDTRWYDIGMDLAELTISYAD